MPALKRTHSGLLSVYIADHANHPYSASDWEAQGGVSGISVDGTSGRLEVSDGAGYARHQGSGAASRSKRMVQVLIESESVDGASYFGPAVCMEGASAPGDTAIKAMFTDSSGEAWDTAIDEIVDGGFETGEIHASGPGKPTDTQMRLSVFHDGDSYESYDHHGDNALGPVIANLLSSGWSGFFTCCSGDVLWAHDWWDCEDRVITCTGMLSGHKLKVRDSGGSVLAEDTETSGTAIVSLFDVALPEIEDVVITNSSDVVIAGPFTPNGTTEPWVAGGDTYEFEEDIVITPSPAGCLGNVVAPAVILGSLLISGLLAAGNGASVDPTVELGSTSVTPAFASVTGDIVSPTVIAGDVIVVPTESNALGATIDPSVVAGGVLITPPTSDANVDSIDPTVDVGSILFTPSTADGNGAAVDPSVLLGSTSLTPTSADSEADTFGPVIPTAGQVEVGFIEAQGATVDPVVILGSLLLTLTPSDSEADTFMSSLVPAPAEATGDTKKPTFSTGPITTAPADAEGATADPVILLGNLTATPEPADTEADTLSPGIFGDPEDVIVVPEPADAFGVTQPPSIAVALEAGLEFLVSADDLIGLVSPGGEVTTEWVDRVTGNPSALSAVSGEAPTFKPNAQGVHAAVEFDGTIGSVLEWVGPGFPVDGLLIAVCRSQPAAQTDQPVLVCYQQNNKRSFIFFRRDNEALNAPKLGYYQDHSSFVTNGPKLANGSAPIHGELTVFAAQLDPDIFGADINHFYYDSVAEEFDTENDTQTSNDMAIANKILVGGTIGGGFGGGGNIGQEFFGGEILYARIYSGVRTSSKIISILDTILAAYRTAPPAKPTISIASTTQTSATFESSDYVPGLDGDPHKRSRWQLAFTSDPTFAAPIQDIITSANEELELFTFNGLDLALNQYIARVQHINDKEEPGEFSDASAATGLVTDAQYYTSFVEPNLGDDLDDEASIGWDEVWADDESLWPTISDETATCEVLAQRSQESGASDAVDPIIWDQFSPVAKQTALARFKFTAIGDGALPCDSGISSPSGKICRISTGFVRREDFENLDEWVIVREGLGFFEIVPNRGHLDGSEDEQVGNSALRYDFVTDSAPNALIVWEGAGSLPEGYWFQVACRLDDILPLEGGQSPWWRTGWHGLAFCINTDNDQYYSAQNAHNCGIFSTWVFQVFYKHFGSASFKLIDTFDVTGQAFGAAFSHKLGVNKYEYMKVGWHDEVDGYPQQSHMAFSSMRGLQDAERRVGFDIAHKTGKVGLVINACGNTIHASGASSSILFDNPTICKGNRVEVRRLPQSWFVEADHDTVGEAFDIEEKLGTSIAEPIFLDFEGAAWPATVLRVRDAEDNLIDEWEVPATPEAPKGIWGGDIFQLNVGGIGVGPIAGPAVRVSGTPGGSLGSGYFAYLDDGLELILAKGDNVSGLTTLGTFEYEHAPSTYYNVVLQVEDTTLRAKVWHDGELEPDWQIVAEDSDFASGVPGIVALAAAEVGFDVFATALGDSPLPTGRNPGEPTWILPTGSKWFTPIDDEITIQWVPSSLTPVPMSVDNLRYEVEYKDQFEDVWHALTTQVDLTYLWDVSSLIREHPHCLRVRALAGCEVGPWAEICEVSELSIGVNCDDYEVIWLSRPQLDDLETDFVAGEVHQYVRRFKGIPVGTTYSTAQLTITDTLDPTTALVQKSSIPVDNGDGSMDVEITLSSAETTSIGSEDAKQFELRLTDGSGNSVIPHMGLIIARRAKISL